MKISFSFQGEKYRTVASTDSMASAISQRTGCDQSKVEKELNSQIERGEFRLDDKIINITVSPKTYQKLMGQVERAGPKIEPGSKGGVRTGARHGGDRSKAPDDAPPLPNLHTAGVSELQQMQWATAGAARTLQAVRNIAWVEGGAAPQPVSVIPVENDGDCGFNAIAEALRASGVNVSADLTREEFVARVLHANTDGTLPQNVSQALGNIEQWATNMADDKNRLFVGDAELAAIAHVYGLQIAVHTPNDDNSAMSVPHHTYGTTGPVAHIASVNLAGGAHAQGTHFEGLQLNPAGASVSASGNRATITLPPYPPEGASAKEIRAWASKVVEIVSDQNVGPRPKQKTADILAQAMYAENDEQAANALQDAVRKLSSVRVLGPLVQAIAPAQMKTVAKTGQFTPLPGGVVGAFLGATDNSSWQKVAEDADDALRSPRTVLHLKKSQLGQDSLRTIQKMKVSGKSMNRADGIRVDAERQTERYTMYRIQAGPSTNGGLYIQRGQTFSPDEIRSAVTQALQQASNGNYVVLFRGTYKPPKDD